MIMSMFKKILIANRGEIACRVIRTARRMGIRIVAVYSDADSTALHVKMADEAIHIGPSQASESYLDFDNIIAACKASGAEAVHPGYGFLSENPDFVEALEMNNICFIGPSANAIRAMGLKDAAKDLMIEAGVPVVPGYQGENQDAEFLSREAEKTRYPVLIKARAGGGGKGMRLVERAADFQSALLSAQQEGKSAFGDAHVLIEKYITRPRHIEIQVFGDNHGNVVHLFERDCSLQRRHQKVIEEAPAPGMTEAMRTAMGDAAVKAAKAVNYSGAGTIEFIVDASEGLQPDKFYFMEMNTRLQVEHPVTEYITGHDLVEWQLRVASGEQLPVKQSELKINGWAFETRIYAENPDLNFLPSTGKLTFLHMPAEGKSIRVDNGVVEGDEITPYYDPMIGKLITHGQTRDAALGLMRDALENTHIAGCTGNISFLSNLCKDADFNSGDVHTGLIEEKIRDLIQNSEPPLEAIAIATLVAFGLTKKPENSPWQQLAGWSLWGEMQQFIKLLINDNALDISLIFSGKDTYKITVDGKSFMFSVQSVLGNEICYQANKTIHKASFAEYDQTVSIFLNGATYNFNRKDNLQSFDESGEHSGEIKAPMPGLVKIVSVLNDQAVKKGDRLISMEAMKMEHSLLAPFDGIITSITVAEGDLVVEGAVLLVMESSDAS